MFLSVFASNVSFYVGFQKSNGSEKKYIFYKLIAQLNNEGINAKKKNALFKKKNADEIKL